MPIEPNLPFLTVRALKAAAVMVPLNLVMGASRRARREVPLLPIDVETEEGVTAAPNRSAMSGSPCAR
ncbi:MAG TPA: hypothetical protein VNR39_22455 [Pseudolabrys sp.]|nr:hypothetical protein [Pseudolabrys sp.]